MITLSDVLSETRLREAAEHLLSKKNTPGPDGIMPHSVRDYWHLNKSVWIKQMEQGALPMTTVRETEIIQGNGKRRRIVQMNALDRLILRSLSQCLQEALEPLFSAHSFAFRRNKGLTEAVKEMALYIRGDRCWMAEIDIKDYFDNISQALMLEKLRCVIEESDCIALIQHYLRVKVLGDEETIVKTTGLLQGSPVSPVLSNLYLNDLDWELEKLGAFFIRYSDNIFIFTKSYEEALDHLNFVKKGLKKEFNLTVHSKKSGIYSVFNRTVLGHVIQKNQDHGSVIIEKIIKRQTQVFRQWHPSVIQKVDRNYHLLNDGILSKRDFTVLFENEDGKRYIPVETTDSLNVYACVVFTGDFLRYLAKKRIQLNLFDQYGNLAGRFIPGGVQIQGKTMIKQVEHYINPEERLSLAKSIIRAAAHNMRSNVLYYKRRRAKEELSKSEQEMILLMQKMNEAKTVPELLLTEARLRQVYYGAFSIILRGSNFSFKQRTKRPPRDAVNAMISFGNTLLYNRLATEIYKSGLDIRVAFLHSTNHRKQSLNLDLAEVFKPLMVDRTIFTLVNKGMLDSTRDFVKTEEGGVYLNKEGKHIFILEWERKLYQKIDIGGNKIGYDALMRREIRSFKRAIDTNSVYKAYKYY